MAYVTLSKSSLEHNYSYLQNLFGEHDMDWAPVLKMLCGNKTFLDYILNLGEEQVCDARLGNLQIIKELHPEKETIYIKPPSKNSIKDIIQYADVSFNTEYITIKWLSEEAKRQNKIHRILRSSSF